MLLQLEDTNRDDVNKLLTYAKENNLHLSLVDEIEDSYVLPGSPLNDRQLKQLVESSRNSGIISMKNAHEIIKKSYNAD